MKFTPNGVDAHVFLPDKSYVVCPNWANIPGSSTYTYDFITRTGHNGLVHMDYDNVEVCTF